MKNKIITYTALLTIILKELRIEKNLNQGWLASELGKASVSSVSKLEAGEIKLSTDVFVQICCLLKINASQIMSCMERHMTILAGNGWKVFHEFPTEDSKAEFYKFMEQYFSEERPVGLVRISIVSSPLFGNDLQLAPIIHYLLSA